MQRFYLIIRSLRLVSWIKNGFIFAPTIFSLNFFNTTYILNDGIAFLLFSLVTGAIYMFNDCFDKTRDQLHPDKRLRPIASGRLPVASALVSAALISLISLTIIFLFNRTFALIAVIYVLMNIFYTVYLKTVVILDVMVIAIGFVLRIEIGGAVNQIRLSPWILIITFLGAFFVGLIKRRQEYIKINSSADSPDTRSTLKKYNLALLDQLISITTATTLISYIIYVLNPDIQEKFATNKLYLTVPFVVFGIFRYLYLTYSRGKGENPAEIVTSDLPFTLNIFLWAAFFISIVSFF